MFCLYFQGIGDVPTYWLTRCDEIPPHQPLTRSLSQNPLYPLPSLMRNSPGSRRRHNHGTHTPQSHRGSPVALASRFDRTSSLRGSLTHYNHNNGRTENGMCNGADFEPLMSNYEIDSGLFTCWPNLTQRQKVQFQTRMVCLTALIWNQVCINVLITRPSESSKVY